MIAVLSLVSAGAGAGALSAQSASVPPRLLNAAAVGSALDSLYPSRVRLLGFGGTARFALFIGPTGRADTVRLMHSTGLPGLDYAAGEAARKARFSPAQRGGEAAAVWTELPLTFRATVADSEPQPTQINILNRDSVAAAAQHTYPADFLDNHVGGAVGISATVDSAGRVVDAYIVETSCFRAADAARSVSCGRCISIRFPVRLAAHSRR
jgi:TonB family protein